MIAVSPYALFHVFEPFVFFKLLKTYCTFSNSIDLHQRLNRVSYVTSFNPFHYMLLDFPADMFQNFHDQGDAYGFSKGVTVFDDRLDVDPSVPCLIGITFFTSNDRRNEAIVRKSFHFLQRRDLLS